MLQRSLFLVSALAVTLSLAVLLAQQPRAAHAAPRQDPPAKKANLRQLAPEDLEPLLENMGYEVEVKKNDKGVPYTVLTVKRDTWTFVITVSISGNGQKLWVVCNLLDLPENPEGARLARLLEENERTGPAFFSMLPTRRVLLNYAVENRLSPTLMREHIEFVMTEVRRTEEFWNPQKWK